MKRKSLELDTLNKKLFMLDFDRSPWSIYSQSNIKVISNLKLERLSQNRSQSNKIDLRMFCEKLPHWFINSSES